MRRVQWPKCQWPSPKVHTSIHLYGVMFQTKYISDSTDHGRWIVYFVCDGKRYFFSSTTQQVEFFDLIFLTHRLGRALSTSDIIVIIYVYLQREREKKTSQICVDFLLFIFVDSYMNNIPTRIQMDTLCRIEGISSTFVAKGVRVGLFDSNWSDI